MYAYNITRAINLKPSGLAKTSKRNQGRHLTAQVCR